MSRFTGRNLSAFITHNLYLPHLVSCFTAPNDLWPLQGPPEQLRSAQTFQHILWAAEIDIYLTLSKKMQGCFNPTVWFWVNSWVCPYLTQIWVKTTLHIWVGCLKPGGLKYMGLFLRCLDWIQRRLLDLIEVHWSVRHLWSHIKQKLDRWRFFPQIRLFINAQRHTWARISSLCSCKNTNAEHSRCSRFMMSSQRHHVDHLSDGNDRELRAWGMTGLFWRTLALTADGMLGFFLLWFGSVLCVSGFDVLSCRNSSVTLNVVLLEDEDSPWSLKFVKDMVEMAVEAENKQNQDAGEEAVYSKNVLKTTHELQD